MDYLREAPSREAGGEIAEPVASADDRPYFNISQAAARLGVSRMTIWRWIRAGRLPVARLGYRTTRIKREDLARLLAGLDGTGTGAGGQVAGDGADRGVASAVRPDSIARALGMGEHLVQFYDSDAYLLDAVANFVGPALRAGETGIVIATPDHRHDLDARLQANGLDIASARAGRRYVALDAADLLAQLLVEGKPEAKRFRDVVGGILARANGDGGVHIFGEMVALLAVAGDLPAAIRLEAYWNALQQQQRFSLFCAYPMECLGEESLTGLLADVCAEHGRVIPAESYMSLSTLDEQHRAIATLQQKARSLEAEIAQRKRTEAQLQAALQAERLAREAAEKAVQVRDEFVSIAAHELKTPLTPLLANSQLLLRRLGHNGQLVPEQVAPRLQAIAGQAEKLSRLINRLLDVSRLQAGKLLLDRQPTSLVALLEALVADARKLSQHHVITLTAPGALDAVVDGLRLEQVVNNLLHNAIKYSPAGGTIEVALSQPAGDWVELAVRDHGLGIPAEARSRLFQRFYQAHGNGHLSGLGLGLYVSRQIVELHGGEIHAEFPADGGSRFVVRLPVAPTAAPAPLEVPDVKIA